MKRSLAIISFCILVRLQAHAADDPFAPHYPFKTAVITYNETDHKSVTTKMVQTIEGEKRKEEDYKDGKVIGHRLILPEAEYYVDHEKKLLRNFHSKSAGYYMRLAYKALPPDQQAQFVKNRASLGVNAPLSVSGEMKPSVPSERDVLGKRASCYDSIDHTGLLGNYGTCYWYGIELLYYKIGKDGKIRIMSEAVEIKLDPPLSENAFIVPKTYLVEDSKGIPGLSQDRYNHIVEKLAYKPNVTVADIDFTAPLMGF